MTGLPFQQVDVFAAEKLRGNPVAVVLGADGLTDTQMAALANWTNLSETTFVLRPTSPEADYRLRIFTPGSELPFAGHPTLGSCHAWLASGGAPRGTHVVQECGIGLVPIRGHGDGNLAFLAPPLRRSGPLEPELFPRIADALAIAPAQIIASQWVDNGPAWAAVLLASRQEVLALKPNFAAFGDLKLGVVAPYDPERDGLFPHFEVRAFAPGAGVPEDPVTGSLNASVAGWLLRTGRGTAPYVARQTTGRVLVEQDGDGVVWVGGRAETRIRGHVEL